MGRFLKHLLLWICDLLQTLDFYEYHSRFAFRDYIELYKWITFDPITVFHLTEIYWCSNAVTFDWLCRLFPRICWSAGGDKNNISYVIVFTLLQEYVNKPPLMNNIHGVTWFWLFHFHLHFELRWTYFSYANLYGQNLFFMETASYTLNLRPR